MAKKARRRAGYIRISREPHKAVPGEPKPCPHPGTSERQNASQGAHRCEGKQWLQKETTATESQETMSRSSTPHAKQIWLEALLISLQGATSKRIISRLV